VLRSLRVRLGRPDDLGHDGFHQAVVGENLAAHYEEPNASLIVNDQNRSPGVAAVKKILPFFC